MKQCWKKKIDENRSFLKAVEERQDLLIREKDIEIQIQETREKNIVDSPYNRYIGMINQEVSFGEIQNEFKTL